MNCVCADCGHEQDEMDRPCKKCYGFRVIAISVAEQLFGKDWRDAFSKEKRVKPANGVKGHLLLDQKTGKHFFRVYQEEHTVGVRRFTDYALKAEDICVVLSGDHCCLVEEFQGNCIDFQE